MNHVFDQIKGIYVLAILACVLVSTTAHSQVVETSQKISTTQGGLSGEVSQFGTSVAYLGDLNGDDINDVMVGDRSENGVVWILLMNRDGTVDRQRAIRNKNARNWGASMAYLGDLDGDNAPEIAIGAPGDFTSGDRGEVWILSLNTNGSVKKQVKIDGLDLEMSGLGVSLAGLGDLDGDGVADLAAGGIDPTNLGAVIVLLLNPDGTVKASEKFSLDENPSGGETGYQQFGWSMSAIGDLDGDNVTDLAVGKPLDNDGGEPGDYFVSRGAVLIIFLNQDGTLKSFQKD